MRRALLAASSSLLLLAACAKPAAPEKPAPAEPERTDVTYLTPVQHLIRVSLDLRGTRPTEAELNDIESHPDKMRHYIRAYMNDPRFADRVKEIWNEGFLTRQDRSFFAGPPQMQGILTEDDFSKAAGNEPLELIAHVVTEDRPFTEVVTAKYTMANEVLAAYYDINRPTDKGPGWIEAPYQDGRPLAGVLSSTDFHTRWRTTDSNRNRGRANAWSRALLCYDFMSRDIIVDTALNLADPNVVNNAVRTNPSCAGCHQTLDPLASYLYGYFIPETVDDQAVMSYPIKTYSMNLEDRWQQGTGRAPGYFGLAAGSRIDDLGNAIADDPRFALCAVKRFEAGFTGAYLKDVTADYNEIDRLDDWFVKRNYNAKDLIEEILMSPQYRIAGPAQASGADVIGLKLLSPEQLDRMLYDLAGFQWKLSAPLGYDLLQNDIYGFRDMAGGYDSVYVTGPAHTVNATHILTLRFAAGDAAGRLVDKEFAEPAGSRRFLTKVEPTDVAADAIKAQAVSLYRALYGQTITPDSQDAQDVYDLWNKAYSRQNDAAYAWKVTLAALFSDVRIAFY